MVVPASVQDFELAFNVAWPVSKWKDMTVVVACSGGADSIALLRCMERLAPSTTTIIAAHFNHQLRGADSDSDEQFVRSLAHQLNVQCEVGRLHDSETPQTVLQSENSLRSMRYRFLEQAAKRLGGRYVVTAHTADDQAETIIHRLCRGAGASGIAGMRMFRELGSELVLARPMLNIWRENVISYLEGLGQQFRSDASNDSNRYTRNRIRNTILPEMESLVHPNAKRNVVETGKNIAELYNFVETEATNLFERYVMLSAEATSFPVAALQTIHPALQKEVMRCIWRRCRWPIADMTSDHWTLLNSMISKQSDEQMLKAVSKSFPGNVLVRIDGETISFKKN